MLDRREQHIFYQLLQHIRLDDKMVFVIFPLTYVFYVLNFSFLPLIILFYGFLIYYSFRLVVKCIFIKMLL